MCLDFVCIEKPKWWKSGALGYGMSLGPYRSFKTLDHTCQSINHSLNSVSLAVIIKSFSQYICILVECRGTDTNGSAGHDVWGRITLTRILLCGTSWLVSIQYWKVCITEKKKKKNTFMPAKKCKNHRILWEVHVVWLSAASQDVANIAAVLSFIVLFAKTVTLRCICAS